MNVYHKILYVMLLHPDAVLLIECCMEALAILAGAGENFVTSCFEFRPKFLSTRTIWTSQSNSLRSCRFFHYWLQLSRICLQKAPSSWWTTWKSFPLCARRCITTEITTVCSPLLKPLISIIAWNLSKRFYIWKQLWILCLLLIISFFRLNTSNKFFLLFRNTRVINTVSLWIFVPIFCLEVISVFSGIPPILSIFLGIQKKGLVLIEILIESYKPAKPANRFYLSLAQTIEAAMDRFQHAQGRCVLVEVRPNYIDIHRNGKLYMWLNIWYWCLGAKSEDRCDLRFSHSLKLQHSCILHEFNSQTDGPTAAL